ncbi:MAG: phosphohydrolase [Desulfobacterales bacterium]|nr:phosphohydrolase [Desulfobacterales bacterium]
MKCPGQDSRYWQPGAIFESKCPQCGNVVEFFKDDTTRKCGRCGHRLANPKMDFGCASYCKFAEQCIGALPEEILARRDDLLKDRIAIEMKKHFASDFKSISRAMRVARHAEKIGKAEGGNLAVILASAYLYDIGGGSKTQSSALARSIMAGLSASRELIDQVCSMIEGTEPSKGLERLNFNILSDALHIADLEEKHKEGQLSREIINDVIENRLLTKSGRETTAQLFIIDQENKK